MEMVMGRFLSKVFDGLNADDRRSTAVFKFDQCLRASAKGHRTRAVST
jgi:hypothetical protein